MASRNEMFRENLLLNTSTTVLIAVGSLALSKLIVALSAGQWAIVNENPVAVGALLTVVLAGLGLYLWRRMDRFRPHFDRMRPDYIVLTKEISYTYHTRQDLEYVKTVTIKAVRDGISAYRDKYNWTGSGDINVDSLIPEHTTHLKGQRNIWQMFEVDLGRNLKKGDTERVAIRWKLTDPDCKARPFMSQSIDVPTAELRFRLKVPQSFNVSSARARVRQTIDILDEVSSEELHVINGEVEWPIKSPRLLHCYELNWVDPGVAAPVIQATAVDGDPLASGS